MLTARELGFRALTAVKLNSYIVILASPKYKNGSTTVKV